MGHELFDLLEKCLKQDALSVIQLDRDESTDSYDLKIENLEYKGDPFPERNIAMRFLPAGSQWTLALGWRSFFGIPFRQENKDYIALGGEAIIKHETRGAYPIFRAYTYELKRSNEVVIENLGKLRDSLGSTNFNQSLGIIEARSKNPDEHVSTERRILSEVARRYLNKQHLYFRTLILAENEMTLTKTFEYGDQFLVATVSKVFSPRRKGLFGL